MVHAPHAQSTASAVSAIPEQAHVVAPEPEIQPEPPPIEESFPFQDPIAMEPESPEPLPVSISIDIPATHNRNGDPEPATSKPHDKTVAGKQEKGPAEKSATAAKQEVLQFEPVTRGRFEKSEPTIIEGEDLDVPTYLRKHVKVK